MPDLYLILHKVRGEPAFDIAYQMMFGDEEGWLIPTSGHRARPYEYWPLKSLYLESLGPITHIASNTCPDDWPDHYQVTREPAKPKPNDSAEWKMLEELGFSRGATHTRRFG